VFAPGAVAKGTTEGKHLKGNTPEGAGVQVGQIESDQVRVDQDNKMSKPKAEGESMSTMRNFDDEDHTPTSPSQDKKMFTKDQLPSQDEEITPEKSVREFVRMLDLTTQTSDNLINEAMKLHMHQDIGLDIIKGAMDLWKEDVWTDGKRPGPQHLYRYVDEVKAKSNRKQTSFVGPNARFEDKEYETLDEYIAKSNSMTLQEYHESESRRISDHFPEYKDELFVRMMEWSKDPTVQVKEMARDAQTLVAIWTEEDAASKTLVGNIS
jgi:hypothetical protein